jgi:hypothetical protein
LQSGQLAATQTGASVSIAAGRLLQRKNSGFVAGVKRAKAKKPRLQRKVLSRVLGVNKRMPIFIQVQT